MRNTIYFVGCDTDVAAQPQSLYVLNQIVVAAVDSERSDRWGAFFSLCFYFLDKFYLLQNDKMWRV